MNDGDKLLCKECLRNWFDKGKYYKILKNTSGVISMIDNFDELVTLAFDEKYINYTSYIFDWFYTEKELRKMKLEKIEERFTVH